jgi:hypothetical protein
MTAYPDRCPTCYARNMPDGSPDCNCGGKLTKRIVDLETALHGILMIEQRRTNWLNSAYAIGVPLVVDCEESIHVAYLEALESASALLPPEKS